MQLVYLSDIFEGNHNIVRDSLETDSVNVMKNKRLVTKKYKKISIYINLDQSRSQMFVKIGVRKNFENFTGKHLCLSLFFETCNFIKKKLQQSCFHMKFEKFLRTLIFTENL